MPCVNQQNGMIEKNKFHMFSNWNPAYTLEKILIGLKNEMVANKKLAQPADGDMFWAEWATTVALENVFGPAVLESRPVIMWTRSLQSS